MERQLDLFPDSLRLTPAARLDAQIAEAAARWAADPSMPNLALLKHTVDARVHLEHGTPR